LSRFNADSPVHPVNFYSDWITIKQDFLPLSSNDLLFNQTCSFVSFASSNITYTESSSEENYRYYTMFATYSVPSPVPTCLDNSSPLIYESYYYYDDYLEYHHGCVSDAYDLEACAYYYSAIVHHKITYSFFCPDSSLALSSSQETKIKENDLISESNSKLGSIASSNSTNTDLLNKIKNSLSALLSTNFAVFGTGAASSNPLNKDDVNSPEYAPTPISSEKDLSDISPLMSKSGSCPADISISVMNSNHHLSYQPLCDFADKLHPLVIAAARVSAAWLVIGAL
jgi:hypothetical protein